MPPDQPTEVVLTSSAWSASASARRSHGSTVTSGSCARSDSARSAVRLVTVTGTPSVSRAAATARAEPPAPSTMAGPRARSTPSARRLFRNPSASVLLPKMRPSSVKVSVLAAPQRVAISSNSSQSASASSLCGMVTFTPANPECIRPRRATSIMPGRTASGT